MNWIKAQNKFSIDNRSIFGKYRRYRYYKGNTSYTYRMGAYRYSIDFQLKEEYFGKELTDEEALEYYISLVKEYGGKLKAKWVYGMAK